MPVARLAPAVLSTLLLASLGAIAVAPSAAAAPGEGPIRVTVVRDYDGDGSQSPVETVGVRGLRVTLQDADPATPDITGTTGADGVVSLDPSSLTGGTYRVRTAIPPALDHLRPAPAGGSGTGSYEPLVTYVTATATGAAVDVLQAVWNPYDFVTDGQIHLAVGLQNQGSGTSVWDANLENSFERTPLASFAETGSISGVAWDRFGRQLFAGSALKRHTTLGPDDATSGVIYRIPEDGAAVPWAVLPAGTTTHDANLDEDYGVFGAVGKEGIGDLQTSEDGRWLYAVNLAKRTLAKFDTTAAGPDVAPVETWPIPVPPAMADRPDDWRPYGLGIRDGILYVGGVDSAESVGGSPEQRRAQLTAHVWTFDEAAQTFGAAPVLSHPLDFERGAVYTQTGAVDSSSDGKDNHWNAWRSDWMSFDDFSAPVPSCVPISLCPSHVLMLRGPQPLLADIAIDNDGSLILGFKDRTADMFGRDAPTPDGGRHVEMMSGGDINRACLGADGGYDWEGENDCPNNGPPGEEVEAYPNDTAGNSLVREHREAAKGPLYMIPSRSWVGMLGTNGGSPGASHTTVWFDRQTGARIGGRITLAGTAFGKGNGLGGVTLLADAAIPVQLGNRTWFDANRDGLQTPGEPDLPGVTVRLIDPATDTAVATTTTDSRGLYYFDDEPNGLTANKDWQLEFDYSTADLEVIPGAPEVEQLEWTTALDDDRTTDEIRSRANPTTGRSTTVNLVPGTVDHTLDAGVRLQMDAYTAIIQVIKYDGQKPDPAITAAGLDIVPAKPLIDPDQDANDFEHAVPYRAGTPTPVRWVATNTSTATWLTDIDLDDSTNVGPDIGGWTCDLRPVGGPARWSFTEEGGFEGGLWAPHVSFFCEGALTLGWDQSHGDTVAVEASVVVPNESVGSAPPQGKIMVALNDRGEPWRVSDRDDFHAKTPKLPELPTLPLPFTGANAVPAALAGFALFLLGVGGLVFAARVRRTMGRRG